MTELKVSVVPRSLVSKSLDRNRDSFDYLLDVAVQKKTDMSQASLDALMTLVEEIADHFRTQPLASYPNARCTEVKNEPVALGNVPHGSARVLWVEDTGSTERWAIVRLDDGDYQAHVLIISNVPDDDGYYPGKVQRYDVATKAWQTLFECKVVDINH